MTLLAQLSTQDSNIILDIFSGSAATAESIMKLNCNENKKRKYIMIQLPENCKETSSAYKNGYRTICDIGIDRIKKAAVQLKKDYPDTLADLGFKLQGCKHLMSSMANSTIIDIIKIYTLILYINSFIMRIMKGEWVTCQCLNSLKFFASS